MKAWLVERIRAAVGSNLGKRIRERLGLKSTARSNHELYGVPVPGAIVVYFGEVATKIYQLEQWLPVLERLHREYSVVLVFRKVGSLRSLRGQTKLPMVFVRRFEDLMQLYDENDYKLGIYVNNGTNNFQSLSHPRMVHVHVNHGESDKLSMVSNQVKAYDRVMIAGPAALQRHREVLVDFEESKLLMVGRPQLDVCFKSELGTSELRTVMYAPTWEGENSANNYSSLDVYGEQIIASLLAFPNTRVVYKPHPRVSSSETSSVREAHETVLAMLGAANNISAGRHLVREQGNILAMFDSVDALVTDVSSVGLDFLYLHPERPLVLTDRRSDAARLLQDAPISKACPVINQSNIDELTRTIEPVLENDLYCDSRAELRTFYFGDMAAGDSTKAFIDAVRTLIADRSAKLDRVQFHGSSMEATDE